MGNFISGADSYLDVYKFNSDQNIDFAFSQLRTFETVKAAGQQQALAQVANVGGLGGGGGGFSALTPWGNSPSIWLGVSNFFVIAATLMVPIGVILAVLTFLMRLGPGAAFMSVFTAMTFGSIWFIYHTAWGRRLATYSTLMVYGLIIGSLSGTVATVAYVNTEVPAVAVAGAVAGAGGDQSKYVIYYPPVPPTPVRV